MVVGASDGHLELYTNTGDASAPVFSYTSDLGDVGSDSAPEFADIDGDGDLDLIYGEANGKVYLRENTGNATSPSFASAQAIKLTSFINIDVGYDATPRFVDIDNDGDLDMFVGDNHNEFAFYENIGTAQVADWDFKGNYEFGLTAIGSDTAFDFADLDNDGDYDMLVGEDNGNFYYFENTGAAESPSFSTPVANPFGLFDIGGDAAVAFGDLDGDGDLDLVAGENDGSINYFENTAQAVDQSSVTSHTLTVEATDGVDTLSQTVTAHFGTSSGDTITGGAADDIIYGFEGDDLLTGGGGDDAIVGGAGSDTVIYAGDKADFSLNFDRTTGKWSLSDGDTGDGLDEGTDTLSNLETIQFGDATDAFDQVIADLFSGEISGGSGADTLSGTTGDDVILGFDGSDIFEVVAASGDDYVHGGTGGGWTDQLDISGGPGAGGMVVDGSTVTIGDWTIHLEEGSFDSTSGDANSGTLVLTDDSSGYVDYGNGDRVTFEELETITWSTT